VLTLLLKRASHKSLTTFRIIINLEEKETIASLLPAVRRIGW
jgi:hypothetical protein